MMNSVHVNKRMEYPYPNLNQRINSKHHIISYQLPEPSKPPKQSYSQPPFAVYPEPYTYFYTQYIHIHIYLHTHTFSLSHTHTHSLAHILSLPLTISYIHTTPTHPPNDKLQFQFHNFTHNQIAKITHDNF